MNISGINMRWMSALILILAVVAATITVAAWPASAAQSQTDGGNGTPGTTPEPTPEPTPDPALVELSEDERARVTKGGAVVSTASWGTVTVRDSSRPVVTNAGQSPRPPKSVPGNSSSGQGSSTLTPLTTDDISTLESGVEVAFALSVPVAELKGLKIERTTILHIPGAGERPGSDALWTLIYELYTELTVDSEGNIVFSDFTVPIGLHQSYKVTPIKQDDTELTEVITPFRVASTFTFMYGWGAGSAEATDEARISLVVYPAPSPFPPPVNQRVKLQVHSTVEDDDESVTNYGPYTFSDDGSRILSLGPFTHGSIQRISVSYFRISPGSDDLVRLRFSEPDLTLMAGVVAPTIPRAPTVTITNAETGLVNVSWNVVNGNKQAIAYEVYRKQAKPISNDDPVAVDIVVGTSLSFYAPLDTIDDSYHYTVRPISIQWELVGVSRSTLHPAITQPTCKMNKDPEWENVARQIFAEPDLSGTIEGHESRSIDIMVTDASGNRCYNVNEDDYYLQRKLVGIHTMDDSCGGSSSCDLRGETTWRTMYDANVYTWGFPRLTFVTFDDEPLLQGKYNLHYRVCMTGLSSCSMPVTLLRVLVGIDAAPFTHDAVMVPVNRVFPDDYSHP